MPEGIISPENREFIGSLGNWTGDATWDPGPIGGWTGLARFNIGLYPEIKTMQLSYPNINTPKNKDVHIVIYTNWPTGSESINRRLRITDGVYTFIRPWDYQEFPEDWLAVGLTATLPPDWNKNNATMFLDIQNNSPTNPTVAYADRASLNWHSPPQYLPIMGVG